MATHSSILVWEIPWTEEPGGLQSMGSQRIGHDLVVKQQHIHIYTYIIYDMSYIYLHVIYIYKHHIYKTPYRKSHTNSEKSKIVIFLILE